MSVRDELQRIYDERGELRPEVVVEIAAAEDHPLHEHFTWDDSEAAHKCRVMEAAALIRRVQVVIDRGPDLPPVRVRSWVAEQELGADDTGPGVYRDVREVLADDLSRTAYFRIMERDWQRLKRKYEAHKEFAAMILADLHRTAS